MFPLQNTKILEIINANRVLLESRATVQKIKNKMKKEEEQKDEIERKHSHWIVV